MFEAIFFPRTAEKYRAARLAEPRAQFLRHLNELGARRTTLRKNANDQLSLVRLLDLQEGDRVSVPQIEAAAAIWALPKGHRYAGTASSNARAHFIGRGIQWLRFLGRLDEPEHEHHPYRAEVATFEKWLRQERGLSTATIEAYCATADHFLFGLAGKGVPLNNVRIADIDDIIAAEYRRGVWKRRTAHDYAQRLKAFFLFAQASGWCRVGLAAGIMPPRFMSDETVPKGIKRDDVLRLMASVARDRPVDKRDRAILMLLIVYGLRAGERRRSTSSAKRWATFLGTRSASGSQATCWRPAKASKACYRPVRSCPACRRRQHFPQLTSLPSSSTMHCAGSMSSATMIARGTVRETR